MFPGLAVGEALVASGVPIENILFVGGSRLESKVYPEAGFPFLEVEIRGLQRRLTTSNLRIPASGCSSCPPDHLGVQGSPGRSRARDGRLRFGAGRVRRPPEPRRAPHPRAERRGRTCQPAHVEMGPDGHSGRFPRTARLPRAEWVGNPIRRDLARFRPGRLAVGRMTRYGLEPGRPVVGVFGGASERGYSIVRPRSWRLSPKKEASRSCT